MKYNYRIYSPTNEILLEGQTSGRGSRKEQREEVVHLAWKNGIKIYSSDARINMKAVDGTYPMIPR